MRDVLLMVGVGVLVFAAAALGDYVEAYYTRAVADLDARAAALMSMAMYAVSIVGLFAFLAVSRYVVIAELFGVGVGAWIAVRRQIRARAAKRDTAHHSDR